MADDTATVMDHLGIDDADVVGYSMGGGIALQLAIRHPKLMRKLVVASASYTSDGMHAVVLEMFPSITPEMLPGLRSRRRTCAPRRTRTAFPGSSRS